MIIPGQMVDLDELVLSCRDEKARAYIREAVACYKSGAFRSAIVAAWIAVVFDILHKLGELDLTGDKNARKRLDDFEKIVAGGEGMLKEALDFEREILNVAANEFELLTPNEQIDLARLQEDRNRCAHPSMQALDTVYEPTAELARSHIRNAVDILLAREPVQGKAAFDRICAEVRSDYFPTSTDEAVAHFRSGPLGRARDSLVRSLVLGLAKAFVLDEAIKGDEKRRVAAALGAVIELHRSRAEAVLREELPKVLSAVPDGRLVHVIHLAWRCPVAWDAAGDNIRAKAKRYLESETLTGPDLLNAIVPALHVADLEAAARTRAAVLDSEYLSKLLTVAKLLPKLRGLVPRLITGAKGVRSFRGAEKYFETLILPIAPILSPDDLRQVLEAVAGNGQAHDAGGMPEILGQIFDRTERIRDACKPHWQAFCAALTDCHVSIDYDCLHDRLRKAGVIGPVTEGTTP